MQEPIENKLNQGTEPEEEQVLAQSSKLRALAAEELSSGHAPTPEEKLLTLRAVIRDLNKLEEMILAGRFDTEKRIGAELEFVITDKDFAAAPLAHNIFESEGKRFTADLSTYNIEHAGDPIDQGPEFLADLHRDLEKAHQDALHAAEQIGATIVLAGVLPTYEQDQLGAERFVNERYKNINAGILALKEKPSFDLNLEGKDKLEVSHPSILLEAVNTSYQLHLSTPVEELVDTYNIVQAISPVLTAVAANSPIVLGKRVWHESRIPVWEQATAHSEERVPFGEEWMRIPTETLSSVASYTPIIVDQQVVEGERTRTQSYEPIELKALTRQNGTLWRWNRVCYGVSEDVPHLRIENRLLPAGPTVLDMTANAAFYYGLVEGVKLELKELTGTTDISKVLEFQQVKTAFRDAAESGLSADGGGASLPWYDQNGRPAKYALSELGPRLIDTARRGLAELGVAPEQIAKYLAVISGRFETGQNGASWILNSLENLEAGEPSKEALRKVTAEMHRLQNFRDEQGDELPVHRWPLLTQ